MTYRSLFAAGALCCAAAVAAGAFGAHALEGRVDERGLELWSTASLYLAFSGFGQLAAALAGRLASSRSRSFYLCGVLLLAGGLIFAATVFALALGGPRWLGAVTPVGGTLLLAGFGGLAWAGWRC